MGSWRPYIIEWDINVSLDMPVEIARSGLDRAFDGCDNIRIGTAAATEMACIEPEGVMEQEQQYLAALGTAAAYKIQGLSMEMRTSEGSLVVTFVRVVTQ